MLSFINRVSLISCVSKPADNYTISNNHFITLPSSTLVKSKPTEIVGAEITDSSPEKSIGEAADREKQPVMKEDILSTNSDEIKRDSLGIETISLGTNSDDSDQLNKPTQNEKKADASDFPRESDKGDDSTKDITSDAIKEAPAIVTTPDTSSDSTGSEIDPSSSSAPLETGNELPVVNIENGGVASNSDIIDPTLVDPATKEVESGGRIKPPANVNDDISDDVPSTISPTLEHEQAVVAEQPATQTNIQVC